MSKIVLFHQYWKIHKRECKPREGSTSSALVIRTPEDEYDVEDDEDDDGPANANSKTKKNRKKNMKRRQKKKELRMTLTGSGIMEGREITSSTLDLDMMKEIHGHLANMALDGERSVNEVD